MTIKKIGMREGGGAHGTRVKLAFWIYDWLSPGAASRPRARETVLMGGTPPRSRSGFGNKGPRGAPTANPVKLVPLKRQRCVP